MWAWGWGWVELGLNCNDYDSALPHWAADASMYANGRENENNGKKQQQGLEEEAEQDIPAPICHGRGEFGGPSNPPPPPRAKIPTIHGGNYNVVSACSRRRVCLGYVKKERKKKCLLLRSQRGTKKSKDTGRAPQCATEIT